MQLIIPGSDLEAGTADAKHGSLPGFAGVRGVLDEHDKDLDVETDGMHKNLGLI